MKHKGNGTMSKASGTFWLKNSPEQTKIKFNLMDFKILFTARLFQLPRKVLLGPRSGKNQNPKTWGEQKHRLEWEEVAGSGKNQNPKTWGKKHKIQRLDQIERRLQVAEARFEQFRIRHKRCLESQLRHFPRWLSTKVVAGVLDNFSFLSIWEP